MRSKGSEIFKSYKVILAFYKKFTCSYDGHLLIAEPTKSSSFGLLKDFPIMISELCQILHYLVFTPYLKRIQWKETVEPWWGLWPYTEGWTRSLHGLWPCKRKTKSVRISSRLLEFPFTQMILIPMHWFSKLLSLTSRRQGNLKQM